MKNVIKTKHKDNDNAASRRSTGERFTKPTRTVPNMAMSINDILIKHRQGGPLNVNMAESLSYTEELIIPNMKALDFTEQAEAIRLNNERVKKLTESYNAKLKQKKELNEKARKTQQAFQAWMEAENPERLPFYEWTEQQKKAASDKLNQPPIDSTEKQ